MAYVQPSGAFTLSSSSKSSSELIAGIIGTIDVGSIIGNAITATTDIARMQDVQARLHVRIDTIEKAKIALILARAQLNGKALIDDAALNLPITEKDTIDSTVDSLTQSTGGFKGASAMLGLEAKIKSVEFNADTLASVLYEIPNAVIRLKAARYYNQLIQYGLPDLKTAMILAKNGLWQYSQFGALLQQEQALNNTDTSNMTAIVAQQVGKPDLYTEWLMVKKGLLPSTEWFLLAKLGYGYTDTDAKALFQNFYYTFSPMELFRILDYADVDSNWLDQKLSMIGLSDADKAIVKIYLQNRIARQETNALWSLTLNNYQWGMLSDKDLTTFLTENNFTNLEANLKLVQAQMQKQKIIQTLYRDAEIYLYRKGVHNENQLLTALQSLGIDLLVANAIVRNEAAKQGIQWEAETLTFYSLIISAPDTGIYKGTTDPTPSTYEEEASFLVMVTAIPQSGSKLHFWVLDGANVGDANPYSVTMDTNHTLVAVWFAA